VEEKIEKQNYATNQDVVKPSRLYKNRLFEMEDKNIFNTETRLNKDKNRDPASPSKINKVPSTQVEPSTGTPAEKQSEEGSMNSPVKLDQSGSHSNNYDTQS
jgi:hypothetical protein